MINHKDKDNNISIVELGKAIRNAKTIDNNGLSIADALDRLTIAKTEKIIDAKKTLAVSEHKGIAKVEGYIRAIASTNSLLQTELELLITTYVPNKNRQGVKQSEAQNILRTAMNSPLKINLDTLSHSGAIAIGSITEVHEDTDRIIGRAVLWNDMFPHVAEYLQSVGEIGSSWEIYYDTEKSVVEDGTLWLTGCVFAGVALVESPAYTDAKAKVIGA